MRALARRVALVAALGVAGIDCRAEQTAPSAQMPDTAIDRTTLLEDSGVSYTQSGGIAGAVTAATLQASKGTITAEYRPPGSKLSGVPHAGTPTDDEYVEVWRELERVGVWALRGAATPRTGADMIRHELRVRVGARSHQLTWFEGGASDDTKKSAALAERVRQAAERAALLR